MPKAITIFKKEDVNLEKLHYFFESLCLKNPPAGIVPPDIVSYQWFPWLTYDSKPYEINTDYWGKCLDMIKGAIRRDLLEWGHGDLSKVDKVGIWLSGGIDSALLLKFTCDILGKDKVVAFNLSFGPIQDETSYAKEVADFCGCQFVTTRCTPQDVFPLVKEATYWLRAPTWCPHVLFMGKLCASYGVTKCFIGLGLDALTGGEVGHYEAQGDPIKFIQVENKLLDLQRGYHWANFYQVRNYVDLKVPYMDNPDLVAFFKSLPINHKVEGDQTKLRIRKEVEDFKTLPALNRDYGRKVGTKKGFGPNWVEWFDNMWDIRNGHFNMTLRAKDSTRVDMEIGNTAEVTG